MNKKIISMTTIFSILMFSGCSNKAPTYEDIEEVQQEKKEEQKSQIENLPSWIIKPEVKNSISSVGMSSFSKHGFHVMLTMAEMDGRAN